MRSSELEVGAFLMPSLGADMEVGTVLEWRVKPGDQVHRGDIVAVVDTEKSDIEVEVFEDGVIEELLVEVGKEVAVGTPLARIGSGVSLNVEEQTPAPAPARGPALEGGRRRSSPRARKLAAEQGVDLGTLTGSGPGGAVIASDLAATPSAAAGPAPPVPAPPAQAHRRANRQDAMRAAIGELMARSKREIPHYYVGMTVDLAAAVHWLEERNARAAVTERILPAAVLLTATARAAREIPGMNGFWDTARRPSAKVHLGVAVSLRGGGLVAPAIHDADTLGVEELMAALRDLVERARAGRLRASEMADPTITVTNLGDQGADEVYGVIYPPQVALVGFGRIIDSPVAVGGLLGVHPTVRMTLAADHRASEGHDGSRFLATIDRLLQTPEEL